MTGKYSVGYFANWGIYPSTKGFLPSQIPVPDLTHVLYAFVKLSDSGSGEVVSEAWPDEQIKHPGQPQCGSLYGNFGYIYGLKKQNHHLKVLLSIGGYNNSPQFHPVVGDKTRRKLFVSSSIKMLENYGLDGLDIDYEYPQDDAQAQGYVSLLKELREGLDAHAKKTGSNYHYLLTVAAPCGPDNYKKLHVAEMDKHLDFWNMMAYDYVGPGWSPVTGHLANVNGGSVCTNEALKWYNGQGLAYDKMVLGIALYGRSYAGTDGMGKSFNGAGTATGAEAGICDYRVLPLPGSETHIDNNAIAGWEYDKSRRELVSYDTPDVGKLKGEWIKKHGLRGAMFWELSQDKQGTRVNPQTGFGKDLQPGPSLVKTVNDVMGGLDKKPDNCLHYPESSFGI